MILVVLLRVSFLNQAIQGDDYYYLAGAMHAQIDPAHPNHGSYVFHGQMVDMRGHPHPPLNMWILGALLALMGGIYEVPFHAACIVFSLIAALAMWSLARRFSSRPLWATLLFLTTPAFVVNGNSLESDVPFLAFWMGAAALFVRAVDRRSAGLLWASVVSLALAALAAYQSVVLIPVLGCYLVLRRRDWYAGWLCLATPVVALGAWQLFERLAGGAMPAGVLAGYFESYGFQALSNKLGNAAALTVHAAWLVFPVLAVLAFRQAPKWAWAVAVTAAAAGAALVDSHPLFWVSFGVGILLLLWCLLELRRRTSEDNLFLAAWVLVFFAAALVLFFAGSARYLLPVAAPVALLVTRQLADRRRWLAAGFILQLLLGLSLSAVNYQHWDGYRAFVRSLEDQFEQRRVWINGEWGLRFYAEAKGGLPLVESQAVQPGQIVLTSKIAYPVSYTTGGGALTPLAAREIRSALPFRLIGIGARSAYSTVTLGYRPFDLVRGPIDDVRAEIVVERKPELSYLPMSAPEAGRQIVSGVYQLESGSWRWMADRAVILLKRPPVPLPLQVDLYIPEAAPARRVTVLVNGVVAAETSYDAPGSYTLSAPAPVTVAGESATVEIVVDKGFSLPGDRRRLGIILSAVGFR